MKMGQGKGRGVESMLQLVFIAEMDLSWTGQPPVQPGEMSMNIHLATLFLSFRNSFVQYPPGLWLPALEGSF